MSPRRLEHGTPEGYARGCTVHAKCPALPVHGLTCETAHIRFESGERRYMTLYGRNMQAAAIARRLGFTPPKPTPDAIAPEDDYPIGVAPDVEEAIAAYAARKEAQERAAAESKELTVTTEPDTPICPECAAGKHTNCDGTAWDNTADEPTTCTCTDHTRAAAQLAPEISDETAHETEEPAMTEPTPTPTPKPKPTRSPKAASRAREQKAKAAVSDPVKRAIVRAWARRAGYEVSDRGAIRQEVVYAYVDAAAERATTPAPTVDAEPDATPSAPEVAEVAGTEQAPPVADDAPRPAHVDAAITPDAIPVHQNEGITLPDDLDIAHRSDFLDETRDRAGIALPHEIVPVVVRPEWGDVATSEDVERARDLAARLEAENANLLNQIAIHGRALEFALRQWALAVERADAATVLEERRRTTLRILGDNLSAMTVHERELIVETLRLTNELADANTRNAALTVQLEQAQETALTPTAKPSRRLFGSAR